MSNQFINTGKSVASRTCEIREELLELLVRDEVAYPWNPTDPDAEAYFDRTEAELAGVEASEDWDIAFQTEGFFACTERAWSSLETRGVRKSLLERFGECVPHEFLETIAARARTIFSASLSPAEQLVNCVQPLLSNWAEEDLYVFARPLAHAMRSGAQPEAEPVAWEQLSAIEQARYTMKVARYALVYIENEPLD